MDNSSKLLGFIDQETYRGSVFASMFYSLSRFLVQFFTGAFYEIEVNYPKNFDPNKSYICVSNHRSLLDPPLIGSSLISNTTFIAKKELFKNKFFATLIYLCSSIYLDRDKPASSSLKIAKNLVNKFNWKLLIFIEGTRSKDEYLGQPQNGAIFLARLCKKPVLPIGISYRKSNISLFKTKVLINIGESYEIDKNQDIDSLSQDCLARIAHLCDYKLLEEADSK